MFAQARQKRLASCLADFGRTVCKFHDFSITQILRENNLGDSAKSAIPTHLEDLEVLKLLYFAILRTLNYDNLGNVTFQKMQKIIKITIQSLLNMLI